MAGGVLYVVATPIGNLEDVTLRALRVLREVDLIAAEDTRRTRILLGHHGIATPVTSYYDAVERERAPRLVAQLAAGKSIALVSDAGTPGIADPGYHLVRGALEAGAMVVPVPGPSSVTLMRVRCVGPSQAISTVTSPVCPTASTALSTRFSTARLRWSGSTSSRGSASAWRVRRVRAGCDSR